MKKAVLFFVILLSCVGCTINPYEKGVSIAQRSNECINDYFNALDQVGVDFAAEPSGKYSSRSEAMNEYLNRMRQCHQKYLSRWGEICDETVDTYNSIRTSSQREEFLRAIAENREMDDFVSEPDLETIDLSPAVVAKVRNIIPHKPTVQQIERDLVGHSLSEGKTMGYYPQSWKWLIEENSISNLHILSVEEDSRYKYTIMVYMRVSSPTRSYDVNAEIHYTLDDINDWQIEYVRSLGMDIVKTNRYNNCVRIYVKKDWYSYLIADNNSEIGIEVAGRYLNIYDEWKTFRKVANPHSTIYLTDRMQDYVIDYVERP